MIINRIPHQARYIPSNITLLGIFNITPGYYVFEIYKGNLNIEIVKLDSNSVYLIDSIQIGGNIPGDVYNESIYSRPYFTLKKSVSGESVLPYPLYITNFNEQRPLNLFVQSTKGNESLNLDFYGTLRQTSDLLGFLSVKISLTFNIYAIDSNIYNREYLDSGKTFNLNRI